MINTEIKKYFGEDGWSLNIPAIQSIIEYIVIVPGGVEPENMERFLNISFSNTTEVSLLIFDGNEFLRKMMPHDNKKIYSWVFEQYYMSILLIDERDKNFIFLPSLDDYFIVGGSLSDIENICDLPLQKIKEEYFYYTSQENELGRIFYKELWNKIAKIPSK